MIQFPSHSDALRIFNDHQQDPLPCKVSRHQLRFLEIGNALMDDTRRRIPRMGNHALHVSSDVTCLHDLERVTLAIDRLIDERIKTSGERLAPLEHARLVQAVARVAGVGACMEYAGSVFADAACHLSSHCTVQLEGDKSIDHCWVTVIAPGLEPIVLDAWMPGGQAVLERDYAYHAPKGGHSKAYLAYEARGQADELRTPEEMKAQEDEASRLRQHAIEVYAATDRSTVQTDDWRIRLSSSVTHHGRPMHYFA